MAFDDSISILVEDERVTVQTYLSASGHRHIALAKPSAAHKPALSMLSGATLSSVKGHRGASVFWRNCMLPHMQKREILKLC